MALDLVKAATRLRLFYEEKKNVSFSFLEGDGQKISFVDLYENAAVLSAWLIENGLTGSNSAIISRNCKFAYESFVSFDK